MCESRACCCGGRPGTAARGGGTVCGRVSGAGTAGGAHAADTKVARGESHSAPAPFAMPACMRAGFDALQPQRPSCTCLCSPTARLRAHCFSAPLTRLGARWWCAEWRFCAAMPAEWRRSTAGACHLSHTLALPSPPKHTLVQIMTQTAAFVRAHGGSVEVMLRLKQAANSRFTFLMPADRLFPWYRWLVEEGPPAQVRGASE